MSGTDIELRISHSQSAKEKVWVTLIMPDGNEFAVGFDENDCNTILQVGETYWEDMTDEERDEPMIAEAQAVLALACYYPVQFVPEPESHELITFLEDLPTKFIALKHVEKVFKQHANMTRWQMYEHIALEKAKGKDKKGTTAGSSTGTGSNAAGTGRDKKHPAKGTGSASTHSRHRTADEGEADSADSADSQDAEDDSADSRDSRDDAHEYSGSSMDEDERDEDESDDRSND
jgi:hypothetical protein